MSMKLYYSTTSPFVRKCLVAAHELGLADRIAIAPVTTMPTAHDPDLMRDNPLCKLPTLVTAEGAILYDSRVICEYLDDLAGGSLVPGGARKWDALVDQALADGILDAALSMRYEAVLRPAENRWDAWSLTQREKIVAALARLEADTGRLAGRVDVGTIAVGCALGYLDLRFPDLDWRASHSGLAAWFAEFGKRPSMQATAHKT